MPSDTVTLLRGFLACVLAAPTWPAAAEGSYVLVRSSEPVLARPHDVVLSPDKRYLFVADLGNDAVTVLDPESLVVVGRIGADELSSPHDVAFDTRGRLLVADSGNDRIAIYELSGMEGRLVETIDGLCSPEGVTAADDDLYVANVCTHDVVRVREGRRIGATGSMGSGDEQFIRPHDIELGPDGRLYVGDPGNNRVRILDRELGKVGMLVGAGYDFNEPKYLGLDDRGWLYVADQHNHVIKVFDADRGLVATVGGRGIELNKPEGIVVRGERMWVADTYNNRVVLFERRGD